MSNKDKAPLLPKLRFPRFRGCEEWQLAPLNQLATRTKQKNRDEKITRVLTNSAEFGVLDQRDFFDKDIATQGNLESYFVVEQGSYVYNPRISVTAPVGPISKNKIGTGVMSPLYTVFKFKDQNNEFYEQYFKTAGWHTYMRQASSTGARHDRMAIASDDFMAMPLPVSTPTEQQKIADCLSSLDELIAAQARKVDALKTHKKGLMQQFFPCEDETQPRLRFPEFQSTEVWRTRKVSSLLTRSVSPVSVESEGVYREIGIRSHGKGIFHKEPLLGKELGDKRVFHVEENAFVLNIVFAWEQAVAVTSAAERGMIASHRFPIYKTNECEADVDFIKYFFLTNKGKELLGIASPGGAGRNKTLGQKEFEKLEFLCPRKVEEQTAIARCLSSTDDLITIAAQELETLKTHKKGLMQQLFPSPEVVEA